MKQRFKTVGYRLFAGFLAVMMLVTCLGEVSYAAEIKNDGSLETAQDTNEQEMQDDEQENTVSENSLDLYIEEENIIPEEIMFSSEDMSDVLLQTGGFLDAETALPPVMFYGSEGTKLVEEVGSAMKAAFDSFAAECSLSQYQITADELKIIFTEVLNTNPEYFYVSGSYRYAYNETTGYVTRIVFSYDYDQATAESMLAAYNSAVNQAVGGVVNTWSDMEKALYINDYLTRNCQYDLNLKNYDAYDVLVSKTAVCQGYALAYMALAKELGLDCEVVTSKSLNHAWNIVSINGNFYNVDTTWNDPTPDLLGRARHFYFMKSTAQYQSNAGGHLVEDDWVVTGGRTDSDASATGYDNHFWNDIDSSFEYHDGYWYNFDGTSEIAKYSCDGSNFVKNAKIQDITDRWYVLNSNQYYTKKFVTTGSYNGVFYYSTADKIYAWNPTGNVLNTIFQLSAEQKTQGYIYGMYIDSDGNISYCHAPSLNGGGTIYTIENTNIDPGVTKDVYYVSQNGDDSNDGTEGSPVNTLYKALELVNNGGYIIVCDNLLVNDNASNDAPLIIEKAVTIQAKDSSMPTIDLRAGGIILGSDVTFKNVKIGTESYLRPGIAANGHKLDLVNVCEDSSLRPLQIYGGTFIDYTTKADYGVQYRGSSSEITIVGGDYDAVYAGSTNGSINMPVTINVSKGNALELGGIYAGSTIKNPSDTSTSGSIPVLDNSINLSSAVNVSISNNAYVTVVDGVSESNTVNLTTAGTGEYSYKVKYLDNLNVSNGTFVPSSGSVLGDNESNKPNIVLEGSADNKATLDLTNCASSSNVIYVNNFTGTSNSIFVLNKDHVLTLYGALSGNAIEFRLSGGMPWNSAEIPGYSGLMEYNKTYISGGTGNGTFVISNPYSTQEDMRFTSDSSVANGWTTIGEEEELELPKLVDFSITSKEVSNDEANAFGGVEVPVSVTFAENEMNPYLYWIPLEYKITYTNISGSVTEYIQQSSVADDSGNYSCTYKASTASTVSSDILMKLEAYADEDGNNTIIAIEKVNEDIAEGTYEIEVTAPTTSGEVTRSFTLRVGETKKPTYSIIYNGNGAAGSMNPQTNLVYDTTYTLSANTFKRNGYTFTGWNTKADGTGTVYSNQASVKNLTSVAGGSVTLYAQWKVVNYSISYHLNGGVNNSGNPNKYNVETATISLKNPTRTGCVFGGWYSDSAFTKKVTAINKGSTGNKTLYAKWNVSKYNVTFNGNGNTGGSMSNMNGCKYGTAYTLRANAFKKNGYTFVGWNTNANGTGIAYNNQASIKNLTSTNGKTITLYAQWKITNYSIKYNVNGGKNHSKNPTSYTVTSNAITLQTPVKTGCKFLGWYSDGTFKNRVTTINKGSTGNRTLYAKWEVVKYGIKYNVNGGKNHSKNPTSYTAATNTIKLQNPTRNGFKFMGWYSDGTFKNRVTTINKGSTGNRTLYAKWEVVKYGIKYNVNGGKNHSKNPTSYTVATNTIKLQNPTRNGFKFMGWYSDGTFKKRVTTINRGSTGNRTLYAKWEVVKYGIKYNVNGGKNHSKNPTSYTVATNTIKLQNPSKNGYKFAGWYSDGTFKKRVTTINRGSTGNKTLYAKWEVVKYGIKYNVNGGKNHSKNPTSYTVATNTIKLQNPTRNGYKFAGWYSDGTFKKRVTTINKGSTGNRTLYAKWIR